MAKPMPIESARTVASVATLLLCALLTACGGGQMQMATPAAKPLQITDGQFSSTPHPQVAMFNIMLPAGASVAVEFGPDTGYGRRTWSQPAPAGGGATQLLVAGMRAFTTYHLHAVVQAASGETVSLPDHQFTTSGLAANLAPQFTVTRPSGAQPASGVELFDLTVPNGQIMAGVLDLDGSLLWHYLYDASLGFVYAFRPEFSGNLALIIGTRRVREIDLAGNTAREITLDDMNARLAAAGSALQVTAFHHDLLPMQNGHLIVLCEETRNFTNLAGVAGTTAVRGDALVDLDTNWKPVWTWSTFDHLDVNRHPMDVQDWTHGNALVYSPRDGALLFSMRNQHWVLKLDYGDGMGSGKVLWRLGAGGDFTLSNGGDADWFFGQHLPSFVGSPDNSPMVLALFDNRATNQTGTTCASDTGTCYSRPVILSVDENAHTVAVQWQQPLNLYSLWGGNAEVLSNGNVEYTLSNPFPNNASRTVELAPGTRTVVWQLDIAGQLAYRAYRIPSLYPGVQW